MGKWIDSLENDQFEQTEGCLKNPGGNCCLGVRYEVEGHIPRWNDVFNTYMFDGKRDTLPSRERTEEWNLHHYVTEEEEHKIMEVVKKYDLDAHTNFEDTLVTPNITIRQDILTSLNDSSKLGFKGIAEVLRTLGWDNSEEKGD